MGSDGLFDNMWDAELEKIVAAHLKVRTSSALLVRSCTAAAAAGATASPGALTRVRALQGGVAGLCDLQH